MFIKFCLVNSSNRYLFHAAFLNSVFFWGGGRKLNDFSVKHLNIRLRLSQLSCNSRISRKKTANLLIYICKISEFSKQMLGRSFKTSSNRFLLHPFQFVVIYVAIFFSKGCRTRNR